MRQIEDFPSFCRWERPDFVDERFFLWVENHIVVLDACVCPAEPSRRNYTGIGYVMSFRCLELST